MASISKDELQVEQPVPGVEMSEIQWGGMTVGFVSITEPAVGLDMAPLFIGLPDDRCQAPHWDYVLKGSRCQDAPQVSRADPSSLRGVRVAPRQTSSANRCSNPIQTSMWYNWGRRGGAARDPTADPPIPRQTGRAAAHRAYAVSKSPACALASPRRKGLWQRLVS